MSPVITRAMPYRQFLIELSECFDGHPTSDHQGRLGLALVRAPGEVASAIADANLVEPPDFDPQGWPDTFNETYVRFTNRDRKFKEDSVAYRDRGNFQVTQAIRSQVLSRPWMTRAAVATKIAWAAGRAAAMPVVTGTLRVRKSKASGRRPRENGSWVSFGKTPWGRGGAAPRRGRRAPGSRSCRRPLRRILQAGRCRRVTWCST